MYGFENTRSLSAPERRRRRILDAAVALIGEGGRDAVTHRAVASRAKVALGSTTYHFGTREELLRAAFHHYLAEVALVLQELAAGTTRAPRVSFESIAALAVETARRGGKDMASVRAEYELLFAAPRDATLARDFLSYQRGLESALARLLEQLDVARPTDAARTVIDMVRCFELERFARPDADTEDLRRRVHAFVAAMSGRGEEPPKRARRKPARAKGRKGTGS
jgi:DNA-binding transcriptional regulator YbjK